MGFIHINDSDSIRLERNICFYFDNPDPSVRRSIVRDFIISGAGFIVSAVEIIRIFKFGF